MNRPTIAVRLAGSPAGVILLTAGGVAILYAWSAHAPWVQWWMTLGAVVVMWQAWRAARAVWRYKRWRGQWDSIGQDVPEKKKAAKEAKATPPPPATWLLNRAHFAPSREFAEKNLPEYSLRLLSPAPQRRETAYVEVERQEYRQREPEPHKPARKLLPGWRSLIRTEYALGAAVLVVVASFVYMRLSTHDDRLTTGSDDPPVSRPAAKEKSSTPEPAPERNPEVQESLKAIDKTLTAEKLQHEQAAAPPQTKTAQNDDDWIDVTTGLRWTREQSPQSMNWQAAVDYCRNLALTGASVWRLPELSELRAITVKEKQENLANNNVVWRTHMKGGISADDILWSASAAGEKFSVYYPSHGYVTESYDPSSRARAICVTR